MSAPLSTLCTIRNLSLALLIPDVQGAFRVQLPAAKTWLSLARRVHSMDRFGTPQQPAWISASTEEMAVRERAFFRSVYGWMFAGLMTTALTAFAVTQSLALQQLLFGTGL